MHQTRPLPDTHPELTITHYPGFIEYKVENWHLARDGSGRVRRGTVGGGVGGSWFDAGVLVLMAIVWNTLIQPHDRTSTVIATSIILALALLLWTRCTQVLHESILVFPTLGIQLETHRGHPALPHHPMIITRHFVHLTSLEDVIIHEGFRRWHVRYYLAVIQRRRSSGSGVTIHVGFENVLPHFPVLREVYVGIQDGLFAQSRSKLVNHLENRMRS